MELVKSDILSTFRENDVVVVAIGEVTNVLFSYWNHATSTSSPEVTMRMPTIGVVPDDAAVLLTRVQLEVTVTVVHNVPLLAVTSILPEPVRRLTNIETIRVVEVVEIDCNTVALAALAVRIVALL